MKRFVQFLILGAPLAALFSGRQARIWYEGANPEPPYPRWASPEKSDQSAWADAERDRWSNQWKASTGWVDRRSRAVLLGVCAILIPGLALTIGYSAYIIKHRQSGLIVLMAAMPMYAFVGGIIFIGHLFRHG